MYSVVQYQYLNCSLELELSLVLVQHLGIMNSNSSTSSSSSFSSAPLHWKPLNNTFTRPTAPILLNSSRSNLAIPGRSTKPVPKGKQYRIQAWLVSVQCCSMFKVHKPFTLLKTNFQRKRYDDGIKPIDPPLIQISRSIKLQISQREKLKVKTITPTPHPAQRQNKQLILQHKAEENAHQESAHHPPCLKLSQQALSRRRHTAISSSSDSSTATLGRK